MMQIENQPKLVFLGVDIITVEYSNKGTVRHDSNIDVKIDPKVFYPENNKNGFSILVDLELKFQDIFQLEIQAIGNFLLVDSNEDEGVRKQFVNVNAPAIIFPYLRSFVSTFTANLGSSISTIIIPTQFFKGDIPEFFPSSIPKL